MPQPRFKTPYERRGVVAPGLPILPHGVERHPIPAGGTRAVPVSRGDEISVLDPEGLQPGEVVFFAPDGASDPGMLGAATGASPVGTLAALANGGDRVSKALDAAGFDLGRATAVPVFRNGSRPGDMERFEAASDGLLIVCATGGPMDPANQNAPTPLVLYIRRATPGDGKAEIGPPDPLADPIADINVRPGTASAYEVKQGEYIQILDVKGRECSDLQAFSRRSIDQGAEREIDPTTTRSLIGALYPGPGLFSKYWSTDQQPLLEVIRDTCGRHDTFGLACTPRFYADAGYPGHANCTENINRALAPYGVAPRNGWPAINLFFNTLVDDDHAIGLNDPWSRPGDYVLLRALTDLVCVSTACPADIDAHERLESDGHSGPDLQTE